MTAGRDFDMQGLAKRMLHDYDAKTPGTAFANGLRLSLEEAWQLQDAVADLREERGERVVGYKIGCVCQENQRANGLAHPVWGRLWSTEQFTDGAKLSRDSFANVAIEGEFAVILSRDIAPDNASQTTIVDSVESIFPVIELHNLMFHGADPKGHELIANNAIHAGVVRGDGGAKPAGAIGTELSVAFDGSIVDQWKQIRWPDDILQAVGWLCERLAVRGGHLQKGETILTGAFGPPIPLGETTHVTVASTQFGEVGATFP